LDKKFKITAESCDYIVDGQVVGKQRQGSLSMVHSGRSTPQITPFNKSGRFLNKIAGFQ
jgi:hypothetical protein